MIQSAKHNGVNFSENINRNSSLYNFEAQRLKGYINRDKAMSLCFFSDTAETVAPSLKCVGDTTVTITTHTKIALGSGFVYFITIPQNALQAADSTVYFKFSVNGLSIFSEFYDIQDAAFFEANSILTIKAYNDDNRHGYLNETYPAFGNFKHSVLKSDIFLTTKVEYEYSYSRKKILSAENQIAKRLVFHDLTMYQQNLLKWLCNTENLYLNGEKYQLVSEFTELESDVNTEIMSLQADFVETEQAFFGASASTHPSNVFNSNFFIK
jgi:hypothetical protein